jgi:hypothetical protein
MKHQAVQDNILLAETYTHLLLEMPVTKANIDKMLKQYFARNMEEYIAVRRDAHNFQHRQFQKRVERGLEVPPHWDEPFDESGAREAAAAVFVDRVKVYLRDWTPKVQQVLRSSGGNPDIFGYPNIDAMLAAKDNASLSNTDRKKAYKSALPENIEQLWETEEYIAYNPKTWEASRKYFGIERISLLDGKSKKGSHWCTAASEPHKFREYVEDKHEKLTYFIRKKDDMLFAARIKNLSYTGGKQRPDKVVRDWTISSWKLVEDMFKAYVGDYKSPGTPSSRRLVENFVNFIKSLDYSSSDRWPLLECRDQGNGKIDIFQMYMSLTSNNNRTPIEIIDGCINFIKRVVYNLAE